MKQRYPVLRIVSKLLIPYIMLFALYVQFHGDFGPGGGFQAGVIFAAAVVLYGLVYGLPAAKHAFRPKWIEILIPLGLLIYAGTGVLTLLCGGEYLEYAVLEHSWHGVPHGQHLGIFLVEFGVGMTVAAVMIAIFYVFAERGSGA